MAKIILSASVLLSLAALPALGLAEDSRPASHYKTSVETSAKVFGGDLGAATAVRAHQVDELLGWSMLLMAQRGHCSVAELIRRRKTMSWGEVAKSTGWDWGALMDEVLVRAKKAGVHPAYPSQKQRWRSGANDPDGINP
jgi:hypothetical protein